MEQYDKIWIPVANGDTVPVEGKAISGIYYKPVKNQIVIAEEELLDLMQESIEHAYPTLLREVAKKLLDAKLKSL
jgi:hypothetical protein